MKQGDLGEPLRKVTLIFVIGAERSVGEGAGRA